MIKLVDLYKQIKENANPHYKIFCDLDQVLSDFNKRFKEYSNGVPPAQYELKHGKKEFWGLIDKIGYKFWSEMPWMPEGKQLWQYISKYKPSILSAPSMDASSRYGKKLWMEANLPGTELILSSRENKKNYSGKNYIFIDDNAKSVEEWRLKGGISILFINTSQTINELKQLGI